MRHLFAGAIAALSIAACGDGAGPSDVIPPELAGSWEASPGCLPSCGFTFVAVANPADSINVVDFIGLTMEVTLTSRGRFDLIARPGGIPPVTGQVEVEGTTLLVRDNAGNQDTLDFTVTPQVLTLRFRKTYDVLDFDGDQIADPAIPRGVFLRRP
jgi:hypothetical protein